MTTSVSSLRARLVGTVLLALIVIFGLPACWIPYNPSIKIGVPYRPQTGDLYCGPASILMWRLFDAMSDISQATIASYIGWVPGVGVSEQGIVMGVNHFTKTWDAYWDLSATSDTYENRGKFFARQITSIDARLPVIAILWDGRHAGVVDGGRWHTDSYTGDYVWDYVYFHDPDQYTGGPDKYQSAGTWTSNCTSQVIAGRFRDPGNANFYTYGYDVGVRGRTDWPPAI